MVYLVGLVCNGGCRLCTKEAATRFVAGCFRFFTLIQCFEGPSRCLETSPRALSWSDLLFVQCEEMPFLRPVMGGSKSRGTIPGASNLSNSRLLIPSTQASKG